MLGRFFAEESSEAPRGSGPGMTIVRTLADKYHGEVWVEDRIKGNQAEDAKCVIERSLGIR